VNANTLDVLLQELEEELSVDDSLPLYQVSWTLAGLGVSRDDAAFAELAQRAYEELRRRHPDLVLAWGRWPMLLETAEPADDGVEVDLDADPEGASTTPMLLLVKPEQLRST
jgi:hypothetical protein